MYTKSSENNFGVSSTVLSRNAFGIPSKYFGTAFGSPSTFDAH